MRAAKVFAIVLLLVSAAGLAGAIADRARSVADIDNTLEDINSSIKKSEEEFAKYENPLLQALIAARLEVQKLTVSMLEQKRASFLHRIDLHYAIDGKPFTPDPPDLISAIEKEIEDAQRDIRQAEEESARYSGGLAKVMAELRRATTSSTLALLQMRLTAARFGMPLLGTLLTDAGRGAPEKASPGAVKPDEDAL